MLNNKVTQLSQHRTKNWVEINAEARRNCNINSQINFKTTMLQSSLCDYSHPYRVLKETITIAEEVNNDSPKRADKRTKGLILQNCVAFNDCTSEIYNTQTDNKKYLDTVMTMTV